MSGERAKRWNGSAERRSAPRKDWGRHGGDAAGTQTNTTDSTHGRADRHEPDRDLAETYRDGQPTRAATAMIVWRRRSDRSAATPRPISASCSRCGCWSGWRWGSRAAPRERVVGRRPGDHRLAVGPRATADRSQLSRPLQLPAAPGAPPAARRDIRARTRALSGAPASENLRPGRFWEGAPVTLPACTPTPLPLPR
jgi:hypothetical protein